MKNLLLFVLMASALTAIASANDVVWTGAGGDNDWNNPGNWSTGRVPNRSDDVTIPSGTPSCMLPGDDALIIINSLTNHGTVETGLLGSKVSAMGDIQRRYNSRS